MAKVSAHQGPNAAKGCAECHDPHQGDDKLFLKAGAKPAGGAAR
jgi:predicted CXXCH cytochrome family protein